MNKIQKLTTTALMAALCYVAFTFIQIKIPTPAGFTSFHLGNVFCVLAALLLDGPTGGLAGAIGMAIGDVMDPVYVIVAPKTIILKYTMGFIAGHMAHKVFHIEDKNGKELTKYVTLSVGIAMLANIVLEPLFSYFYYNIILSNSDKALSYLTLAKWVTTTVNSVLTLIITTPLYLFLSKRILKK